VAGLAVEPEAHPAVARMLDVKRGARPPAFRRRRPHRDRAVPGRARSLLHLK
jgi:hypothetical protein